MNRQKDFLKEYFVKAELLRRGGVILKKGFYVLTTSMESQYNTCSGPFTQEEADARVDDHRDSSPTCCFWTEGAIEIYFKEQVYEFDNQTRKFYCKRRATADERWMHMRRKSVYYLRDGNLEWIDSEKNMARFDKSFNGWSLIGKATLKDYEFAENNKIDPKTWRV